MATNMGIDEFLELVGKNKAIQDELRALDGLGYDELSAGVVRVGAKHGYTFDTDDAEEVIDETLAEKALTSGELSDEQLEAVAGGGKGGAGLVLIGTIGTIVDNTTDDDDDD